MQKELEQLGFNEKEAKIYLALLEFGQSTAGPIVKKTGLHRQVVYDKLEKLKAKNLATEIIKSNRKNWVAADPSVIIRQIDDKKNTAEEVLPSLLSLQSLSGHRQEIKVFEGYDGFRAVHMGNINNQPKDTVVPVIGAIGWDWVKTMKKSKCFKKYEKLRLDKNISHHLIFFKKEKENTLELIRKYYADEPAKSKRVYRFLSDEFQNPVSIQIWHDNVMLVIYSAPILVVQIKNEMVVKNFYKYFEILWKIAKK